MRTGIFGSCVSRDACEFMPNAEVVAYVARHSATSLKSPHIAAGIDLDGLDSPFQKRMVVGDLNGTGLQRITEVAEGLDVVLIDLVDERRGYWQFPDGSTVTNSVELESCGAARQSRSMGARLVRFGTDEHFENWKSGFEVLVDGLTKAQLLARSIFIDIEWAAAFEGSLHPQNDTLSSIGRRFRRLQRGAREANRSLMRGQGVYDALTNLRHVRPTEAEEYSARALAANTAYARYRKFARSKLPSAVTRRSDQVRIGRDHKWGPQPFHYRDEDYRSIMESVTAITESFDSNDIE